MKIFVHDSGTEIEIENRAVDSVLLSDLNVSTVRPYNSKAMRITDNYDLLPSSESLASDESDQYTTEFRFYVVSDVTRDEFCIALHRFNEDNTWVGSIKNFNGTTIYFTPAEPFMTRANNACDGIVELKESDTYTSGYDPVYNDDTSDEKDPSDETDLSDDPSDDDMSCDVGDVVRLKSGGPDMTVVDKDDPLVEVMHFPDDQHTSFWIPAMCLAKV